MKLGSYILPLTHEGEQKTEIVELSVPPLGVRGFKILMLSELRFIGLLGF